MTSAVNLDKRWHELPAGARLALEERWAGLAAGGLPCGSAVIDANGSVIASGRNHAYDSAREIETRAEYPLQHNRLAHAELNALALVPTETDHGALTLWTTQHPCSMCAAAIAFTGIDNVRFIADDPSDDSPPELIVASRKQVPYQSLGDPLWWTASNLLFLYNSAVQFGENSNNLKKNRDRYPELVDLTLELAKSDSLGESARYGTLMPITLDSYYSELMTVSERVPRQG